VENILIVAVVVVVFLAVVSTGARKRSADLKKLAATAGFD
jgi:hypothetical protein